MRITPSSQARPGLLGTALSLFAAAMSAHAGLVIYYPLDEASGNVAFDQANNDGIQNATATVAASNWQTGSGIVGGALQLSPTGQADVDEALIFNGTIPAALPFTLSIWVKTTDATAANHAALYLGDATFDHYYAVGTSATHIPQMIGRNTAVVATVGPSTVNEGMWHNLVAVYSAVNSRSFYVDGKLVGTSTTSVPAVTLTRFGVGALTRSTQTDAFSGMLDEVGMFDTALTGAEAALINAFPRYDNVPLSDSDYALALNVFNTQSGTVDTGTWEWSYATGLTGVQGSTGVNGGNPFVVLDSAGNGLVAIPEPSVFALGALGALLLSRRRKSRQG